MRRDAIFFCVLVFLFVRSHFQRQTQTGDAKCTAAQRLPESTSGDIRSRQSRRNDWKSFREIIPVKRRRFRVRSRPHMLPLRLCRRISGERCNLLIRLCDLRVRDVDPSFLLHFSLPCFSLVPVDMCLSRAARTASHRVYDRRKADSNVPLGKTHRFQRILYSMYWSALPKGRAPLSEWLGACRICYWFWKWFCSREVVLAPLHWHEHVTHTKKYSRTIVFVCVCCLLLLSQNIFNYESTSITMTLLLTGVPLKSLLTDFQTYLGIWELSIKIATRTLVYKSVRSPDFRVASASLTFLRHPLPSP